MLRHTSLIVGAAITGLVLTGCDDTHSAPTSPSQSAASSTADNNLSSISGSSNGEARSGPLHITKECSQYTGLAGSFCTITSSNIKEVPAGTKVVYASGAGATTLDTDFMLDPPGNGKGSASGHVTLDRATGRGVITISTGAGKLKHFTATILVTPLAPGSFAWDGTFSFADKGDRCDDR